MLVNTQETKGTGALVAIDSQGFGTFLLVGKDGVCMEVSSDVRFSSLTIGETYVVYYVSKEMESGEVQIVICRAALMREGNAKAQAKVSVKHEILNRINEALTRAAWTV